jgi:hypothetical protein
MIRFYYHPTPNPAKIALFLNRPPISCLFSTGSARPARKPRSCQHVLSLGVLARYLALSWTLTALRAIADVLVKARSRAAGLAARLDAPPVDRTTNAALCAAVEPFADDVIAKWSLYVAFCGQRRVRKRTLRRKEAA